jgi:hypothetical protein
MDSDYWEFVPQQIFHETDYKHAKIKNKNWLLGTAMSLQKDCQTDEPTFFNEKFTRLVEGNMI